MPRSCDRPRTDRPRSLDRPARPDGTLDVLAWCRELDAAANVGAGRPRGDDR